MANSGIIRNNENCHFTKIVWKEMSHNDWQYLVMSKIVWPSKDTYVSISSLHQQKLFEQYRKIIT